MVSSILVGVDDSDGAATTLDWAARLVAARREGGKVVHAVAVAAWSPPALGLAGGLSDTTLVADAAAAALDRQLARLPEADRFDRIVVPGPPAEVLVAEAERRDVDLIVVGSRGRGGLTKLLLGSVSRSVAARADRPVAVVPAGASWNDGPVVVGFDGSPGSEAALRWALVATDGPVTVLSAWSLPTDAVYDAGAIDVDGFDDRVSCGLAEAIETMATELPDRDVASRVTPVAQRDDPRLALVEQAKPASMVVLGARANRGLRGLLLGSTVDYVASHSSQPVVVIPPPHETSP